jgi:PAS domain S-box-containing protein
MKTLSKPQLARGAVSIAATSAALLFSLLFHPISNGAPLVFFLLAVVVAAWYGGFFAGIITILFAIAAIDYFFRQPLHSFTVSTVNEILELGVFAVTGIVISALGEARGRAQREAELQRARLETILRQLPVGVVIAEAPSMNTVLFNDQSQRIAGYHFERSLPMEQLQPEPLVRGYHPDGQLYALEEWPISRAIQRGEYTYNEEVLLRRADGSQVAVEISAGPILDRNRTIIAGTAILQDVTERKRTQEQLFALQRASAALEERQRLARELHDAVSQTLFSASLTAETLLIELERNPQDLKQRLERLVELTQGAFAEMRILLLELRPEAIVKTPLSDLVQHLISAAHVQKKIIGELWSADLPDALPTEMHVALYRIAQECINNILKHSQATLFRIELIGQSAQVLLRISDDGQGFDTAKLSGGLGLGSMRERAAALDATLNLTSAPGEGTTITVVCPIA